jgi:flagellar FliL protein
MAGHDDDDDAEGEGGGEPSGGGGKKKLLIIIGAAVFVLLGAGAGLFFTGLLDPLLGNKPETAEASPAEAEPAKGGKDAGPTGPVAFFDMPEMIVSLNTSTKSKAAFMKIRLSLEVPQSSEIPKVQAAMPRIIDNLQGYLRELRVEELKGSAGTYRLKEEMLTRIRVAVAPAKVNEVLFKELQIQ